MLIHPLFISFRRNVQLNRNSKHFLVSENLGRVAWWMNVEGAYTRCTHMCYLIDSAVMISCHIAYVYNFYISTFWRSHFIMILMKCLSVLSRNANCAMHKYKGNSSFNSIHLTRCIVVMDLTIEKCASGMKWIVIMHAEKRMNCGW